MLFSLRFLALSLVLALAGGGCSDGTMEAQGSPRADSPSGDEIADLQDCCPIHCLFLYFRIDEQKWYQGVDVLVGAPGRSGEPRRLG